MTETMTFTWLCNECHLPVGDDRGYLAVDFEDIRKQRPSQWLAYHDRCREEEDSYWIPVEEVRDPRGAGRWTEHLSRKRRQLMAVAGFDARPHEVG